MDVTKIVINRDYGRFELSDEAYSFIAKKKGWQHACDDYDRSYFIVGNNDYRYADDLDRDDQHDDGKQDLELLALQLPAEQVHEFVHLHVTEVDSLIHLEAEPPQAGRNRPGVVGGVLERC